MRRVDKSNNMRKANLLAEQRYLASKEVDEQVDAYHGTPHEFDKFDISKVGTGQGAASFGWGLYFTDVKEIGEKYAKDLSDTWTKDFKIGPYWLCKNEVYIDNSIYNEFVRMVLDEILIDESFVKEAYEEKGKDAAIQKVREIIQQKIDYYRLEMKDNQYDEYYKKAVKVAEDMLPMRVTLVYDTTRTLYHVTLHHGKTPEQYDWLMWQEAPTDQQLQKIAAKDEHIGKVLNSWKNDPSLAPASVTTNKFSGEEVYHYLTAYFGDNQKEASLFLLSCGIDGIKYPTDTSGMYSSVSVGFNYVVFDDGAVTINKVEKQDRAPK